ncbi:MAG: hypothetical protein ACI8RD_003796 [Bacillariaceae sp.]|jgi:hypothetical protein
MPSPPYIYSWLRVNKELTFKNSTRNLKNRIPPSFFFKRTSNLILTLLHLADSYKTSPQPQPQPQQSIEDRWTHKELNLIMLEEII